MRSRALGAALAALVLYAIASQAAEIPKRTYVPRLYRSAVEREALVGHGARLLGMGSAGVALAASADAVAWNPAALDRSGAPTVQVLDSAATGTSRSRLSAMSGAAPLTSLGVDGPGGIGAAAWFDGWGKDTDKQRSFLAGYGASVGPLSAGVALRHERHYFGADVLSAWSADLGLMAGGVAGGGASWGAGLSASRLGEALRDQRGLRAPRGFSPARVGAGGWYALATGPLLVTELSYVGDAFRAGRDRVRWRIGAEQLLLGDRVGLRAGYTSIANYDRISHGLTSVGASVNVDGGSLDYAFVTGSDGLGEEVASRHYLSFRAEWAGRPTVPDQAPWGGELHLPGSATPAAVSVRSDAFSPNGDGVRDVFALDAGLSDPDARLVILSSDGATVATTPVSERMVASWDGLASDGSAAPDGPYRWDLVSRDRVIRSGVVLRDATPPSLSLSATVVAVLPGDANPYGAVRIGVDEDGAIEAWSLVVSTGGDALHESTGAGRPPAELTVADIDGLSPGRAYDVTLRVTDEAGNESAASTGFAPIGLSRHDAGPGDGDVWVDMPSTYFDAGGSDLSRDGRALAEAIGLDGALYVAVAEASDALAAERSERMAEALVEAGMPAGGVGVGPPADWAPGTAPGVRLVLSRRRPPAADRPPQPGMPGVNQGYRVLVGSFRQRANAEEAASTFTAAGFSPSVREVVLASGRWYRVTLGSFDGRGEAEELRAGVRDHVADEPVILPPAGP
ncbi:hypothetical protein HN371_08800 [Candidatus Poribacteria bacterium]|jgi:hypothetical protein|nr:hypothetical protein [Candidatus Poribacteria bacterium]MBT7804086.1 hypothetical protein [Candidatus Poribacteria bacterium]